MGRGGKTLNAFSLLPPCTSLTFLAAVTLISPLRVSFQGEIVALMSQSGKTRRQIETWFRLRRSQDRPCQTKKFGEAAWVVQIVKTSPSSHPPPASPHPHLPHLTPTLCRCVCRLVDTLTIVILTLRHPGGDSSSTSHRLQLDWPVWSM